MASDSNTREKLMWMVGTAAVTTFVIFQMNKYLKEKDQLADMRAMEKLKASLPELAEG